MIYKNGTIKNSTILENALTASTYTINGELVDNNGIFSGFSAANYITTNGNISADTENFIVFGHYKTSTNLTTEQYIGCTLTRNLAVKIQNSKFVLQTSTNGAGWNTIVTSTKTVSENTDYFYKIISDNTKLYLYINEELWVTLTLVSGTYTTTTWGFGNHLPTKVSPSLGTINIKECGIIINNVATWSGTDAYTVDSNAKISENYISGKGFYEV